MDCSLRHQAGEAPDDSAEVNLVSLMNVLQLTQVHSYMIPCRRDNKISVSVNTSVRVEKVLALKKWRGRCGHEKKVACHRATMHWELDQTTGRPAHSPSPFLCACTKYRQREASMGASC
jgi:hypothetical protein